MIQKAKTTTKTTTAPMPTRSMATKRRPSIRGSPVRPRCSALSARNARTVFAIAWPVHSLSAVVRPAFSSDSDSDYGARANKKKKKMRASAEEVRVSNRGIRVRNCVDDIQDLKSWKRLTTAAMGIMSTQISNIKRRMK